MQGAQGDAVFFIRRVASFCDIKDHELVQGIGEVATILTELGQPAFELIDIGDPPGEGLGVFADALKPAVEFDIGEQRLE